MTVEGGSDWPDESHSVISSKTTYRGDTPMGKFSHAILLGGTVLAAMGMAAFLALEIGFTVTLSE